MRISRTVGLLFGMLSAVSCRADPALSASWRFAPAPPPPQEHASEKLSCTLAINLPDGVDALLSNHNGTLFFSIIDRAARFGEFIPATITLTGPTATLALPARPIVGGIVLAPLSETTDPRHKLVSIISVPFHLTVRVGTATIADEPVPAVPNQLGRAHSACLVAAS